MYFKTKKAHKGFKNIFTEIKVDKWTSRKLFTYLDRSGF